MLTFQILVGGETYLRPLEAHPLTVGSAPEADISLSGSQVAAAHAQIEPTADGCRIRVADGVEPVRINGMALREADLVLGDRIEIGEAVLVLGNQVKRPATAGDLLDGGPPRRRTPFEDGRNRAVKRMYVAVALVGIAIAYGLYSWGVRESGSHLPYAAREKIVHARKTGRFDDARQILDRLETDWAKTDAGRLSLVREHRQLVAATAEEFEKLHAEYMARVLDVTKAEQLRTLRARAKDAVPARKEALRILAAGLTEFRIAAEKVARARQPASVGHTGGDIVAANAPPRRAKLPRPEWLDAQLAAIRKLHEANEHLQAWELGRQVLPDVPVEHADSLRNLLADVRAATREEMKKLVDQAFVLRANGRLADGVRLLQKASIRFPAEGELSMLYHVLGNLSAELGVDMPERKVSLVPRIKPNRRIVKDEPKRKDAASTGENVEPPVVAEPASTGPVDKSLVAATLVEVRQAEAAGELDEALSLLTKSITNLASYQPELAKYLGGQKADLQLIRDLAAAVAAKGTAACGKSIKLAGGERATVQKLEGQKIYVKLGSSEQVVSWTVLPIDAAAVLATAAAVGPALRLGVGAIGYRNGNPDAAEAYLARLLGSDTRLFGEVSKVVARGRGEVVDADGYALMQGKFVARRFLKVEKLARQLGRKLNRLTGQTPAEREKVLEQLRESEEPGIDDAIVLALKSRMDAYADKLARSNIPKSLARIAAVRDRLDKARKHARDLIFDHVKYFYPYKPPAVSGARFSEYNKVQKEVDARVAAVRKIWHDRARVPLGAATRKEIDALLWVEDELGKMGEVTDRALARVDWVRTIPPVAEITVRNFCRDAEERERLLLYMRIERLNEALSADLNSAEIDEVEITNSYRLMFGHRPLAINRKLHKAARGHAEEMATLGYFSHTSPTEDRRTPSMRMRKEGYNYGISENIAGNPSAAGAHNAWCHSSGHHRNLLNAGHTEFGVGNTGRLWVQNFGRGTEYLGEKDFPK